ncbi:MAG: hypothetical protein RR115_08605 [Hydrogenoanaerobacterium sp.]
MPSMYMGKAYGMVECDEIFETDHGKDGITRVGITRPKVRDEEAAKRNRAAIMRTVLLIMQDNMEKEDNSND